MAEPLISIITPTYNCGAYIRDCIESVIAQGYEPFEHIIMDNCSQDETIAILKEYPHIQWVSEPDEGEAQALNKALRLAKGDIIGWLNADDLYEPGAFDAVGNEMKSGAGKHVFYGRTIFLDELDELLYEDQPPTSLELQDLLMFWRQPLRQPSMFYSGEAVRAIGEYREDYNYSIDYDYWLRLSSRYAFMYVDKALSRARHRPGSKSRGTVYPQFLSAYEVSEPYRQDCSLATRVKLKFLLWLDCYPRLVLVSLLDKFGIHPPLLARLRRHMNRSGT